MIAPTVAAATATVSMEIPKRSRMRVLPVFFWRICFASALLLAFSLLLQRIVFNAHEIRGVVLGRRVWATSLRIGQLFHTCTPQQPRMAIVSFDAARLVVEPVVLLALSREILFDGPGPGPHRRILDRHDVFQADRTGAPPALHQVKIFARALIVGLRTEVGDVNDEGVALPTPARIAVPLADTGRQMRPPIHDDVALPALTLPDVVKD